MQCLIMCAINTEQIQWGEWTVGECSESCKQTYTRVGTVTESCNSDECPGNKRQLNLMFGMLLE